jgi:hypothetical protein
MANLLDVLQSAQAGKVAENLAARFGISAEQAKAAIQGLVPALSAGLLQALQSPTGLNSIAGQLSGAAHQASFQSADSAYSDAGVTAGSALLGQLFGAANVTMQIAQQVARVTGLRADVVARMAPVVATITAGALMIALKSQGFSSIRAQSDGTSRGGTPATGGLAALFSSVMGLFGALTGAKPTGATASSGQSAVDALKGMIQAGSWADPQLQAAIGDILRRRG